MTKFAKTQRAKTKTSNNQTAITNRPSMKVNAHPRNITLAISDRPAAGEQMRSSTANSCFLIHIKRRS